MTSPSPRTLLAAFIVLLAGVPAGASAPFNPFPAQLQTPLKPGGPQAALARLEVSSGGLTPVVKHFTLPWVRSLAERGRPTVYTRKNSHDFAYIGMPVGGIGAGQLYLGGDGQLWWWDIFNTFGASHATGVAAYAHPVGRDAADVFNRVDQGFAIRTTADGRTVTMRLNRDGPAQIEFRGQYPIGYVTYRDPRLPVQVELEAFSPFVPLNLRESSYPATILHFTITNTSRHPVTGELAGWLENAAYISSRHFLPGELENHIKTTGEATTLVCTGAPLPPAAGSARPDIVFDDFEEGTYRNWTVMGHAFGRAPTRPDARGRFRHPHGLAADSRPPRDTPESADSEGMLVSKPFRIVRDRITFEMSGNYGPDVAVNLLAGPKGRRVLRTTAGLYAKYHFFNPHRYARVSFDVRDLQGQTARLEVIDGDRAGSIAVDQIIFTDRPEAEGPVDAGSLALSLAGGASPGQARAAVPPDSLPFGPFDTPAVASAKVAFGADRLAGSLGRDFTLAPGQRTTITYVLTWYFPHLRRPKFKQPVGRWYGARFTSARQVAYYVVDHLPRLAAQTRLWHDTWYDSTLPWWFLDRTFLNTSILATSTSYLFRDGRFYGYEGYYQGAGTCTHVWSYAQAPGRLFPSIERGLRERVDYNPAVGFNPQTGEVYCRGHTNRRDAVDGQSGVILRTYLADEMSTNYDFLRRVYAPMKQAMNYLINTYDADHDGILTGPQHNTLDGVWYGKITWLSLYYDAALRAAGQMAEAMGDPAYAHEVRTLADRGRAYIQKHLFNGEYFIQQPDPKHPDSPGVFNGCEYSQLLGQGWAYQVGLGQILDPREVTTALNSLWKYNFTTDVGPYRAKFPSGRWFAMPGEGGLIACTWPRGGSEVMKHGNRHFAAYLNECQDGYEYAATSLMMWDGLVDKALAHTKVMNERYAGSKRNPWDEIEWGMHYARSMASYGLFTAICGFESNGPEGYIAFSPRLTPDHFQSAFTAAGGWGTFVQRRTADRQTEAIEVKHGHLRLAKLGFDLPAGARARHVAVAVAGQPAASHYTQDGRRIIIHLEQPARIDAGSALRLTLTFNQ